MGRFTNNNGFDYFVTFLSELGNLLSMTVHDFALTGPDAKARVTTIRDGELPLNYGKSIVNYPLTLKYTILDLKNGIPYYIRVQSRNDEGMSSFTIASPAPIYGQIKKNVIRIV